MTENRESEGRGGMEEQLEWESAWKDYSKGIRECENKRKGREYIGKDIGKK